MRATFTTSARMSFFRQGRRNVQGWATKFQVYRASHGRFHDTQDDLSWHMSMWRISSTRSTSWPCDLHSRRLTCEFGRVNERLCPSVYLSTAASSIRYSASLGGSVTPAQPTRSTGLLCGWPAALELSTRQLERSGSWQGRLQTSAEDAFIYTVLKPIAY